MISLIIKGPPHTAVASAFNAGVNTLSIDRVNDRSDGMVETFAHTEPEYERQVIAWFLDPTEECIQGVGYPMGSLLHYSLGRAI